MMKIFLLLIIAFQAVFFWKYIPVEIAMYKVSRMEYGDKACLDFSNELVDELSKRGVQSEVVIGESPSTAKERLVKHAWVSIWVEPQAGVFTRGYFKKQ